MTMDETANTISKLVILPVTGNLLITVGLREISCVGDALGVGLKVGLSILVGVAVNVGVGYGVDVGRSVGEISAGEACSPCGVGDRVLACRSVFLGVLSFISPIREIEPKSTTITVKTMITALFLPKVKGIFFEEDCVSSTVLRANPS